MRMDSLLLRQFRNYRETEVEWHPELNLLFGSNAQGKTNLLEAIAYLSIGSSFRGGKDMELIGWQQPFFYLQGQIQNKYGSCRLSVGMDDKKRKLWRLDGQAKKRFQEIVGRWHTVVFSPEDLTLVKNGPAVRRGFLDQQMIQLYPDYYPLLLQYRQALLQRNEMLRQCRGRAPQEELLLAWDESLVKPGALLWQKRRQMVDRLAPLAMELHRGITGNKEELSLTYQGFLPVEMANSTQKELEQVFLEKLAQGRREDLERGLTLVGPHRDDLEICINGQPARQFASQGQQRTAALSLKLSQVELVLQEIGEYPALLLDDVLSELDDHRKQQLLQLMEGKAQTFITATDNHFILPWGYRYRVEDGDIKKMAE